MRIGIDVGGTNTDAVLLDGIRTKAWRKMPTTADVRSGIINVIRKLLDGSATDIDLIDSIMIGTTQFTNAVAERRRLLPVGVIRIALPATAGLRPFVAWPQDLKNIVCGEIHLVRGGYQYDGSINSVLDEVAVAEAARSIRELGLEAIAISGLFSPLNAEMELRAAEIIQNVHPDARITLSHSIGRLGLLERENAAIINASLSQLAVEVVSSFRNALADLEIDAPFFISQNDGTLMNAATVEQYPVLTFASGPTNSMRGAAFLSGVSNGLVIDIGGTTTDIGVLVHGFPRESSLNVDIGGIRTNFRMPDILSVALGGGSLVRCNDTLSIGPQSVGFRILEEAIVFGGETLTATDIAVAAGYADIGDRERVAHLSRHFVDKVVDRIHTMVEEGIDRMKTSPIPVPVILVGGGAVLINRDLAGAAEVIVPDHAPVANAIGAAIAQVAGETDRVYSYGAIGREAALADARQRAIEAALDAGAEKDSIQIFDIDEVPLAYVPGGAVRVRVKATGALDLSSSMSGASETAQI